MIEGTSTDFWYPRDRQTEPEIDRQTDRQRYSGRRKQKQEIQRMDLENRRGGNGQSTDWPDGHMVSSVPFSAPLQSGEQSGRLP